VQFPEVIEWPLTQNLAYRIVERLDGFSKLIEDRNRKEIRVTGYLPLADEEFATKKKALCVFDVNAQWVCKIPEVMCLEPWVTRKLPEWHADEYGRLCFEFNLNWERKLPVMVEHYTLGLTADYATKWLLNSTRSLLNRHLFAFRNGINAWPKCWDYWAHGMVDAERQLSENQLVYKFHA
jgi:hypothetical protein